MKTQNGLEFICTRKINPEWSEYNRQIAESHLRNWGMIVVDTYKQPIDNERDLKEIEETLNGPSNQEDRVVLSSLMETVKFGLDIGEKPEVAEVVSYIKDVNKKSAGRIPILNLHMCTNGIFSLIYREGDCKETMYRGTIKECRAFLAGLYSFIDMEERHKNEAEGSALFEKYEDEEVKTITWSGDDILSAMADKNIPFTEENYIKIRDCLKNNEKSMKKSVSAGWDAINEAIDKTIKSEGV